MRINERVAVPIVWVAVSAPFIVSSLLWAAGVAFSSEASAKRLNQVEDRLDKRDLTIIQMGQDIAVIKRVLLKEDR